MWGASLDSEPTTARNAERKRRRCFHRVMSGLEKGGHLRLVTLTSAPGSPPDMQRSWRKLVMRLRRRGVLQDYIKVPEMTREGRLHYHILYRGVGIRQEVLSRLWLEIHGAPVVDIRPVRGRRGDRFRVGCYLAKYMAGATVLRYSWSWGWVFRGFVRHWEELKRSYRWFWRDMDLARVLIHWRWWVRVGKVPWFVVVARENGCDFAHVGLKLDQDTTH